MGNGELKGAVHEVPAIFGAPALNSQVNDASQGSLTVGTSAVITHTAGEPIVRSTPLLSPPSLTTARGRLRPHPRPRLTPTSCTVATTAMDTPTATTATTERGVLMLSPRLIPTCCMVDTMAMATATATPTLMEDTTTESRPLQIRCKLHPA